MQAQLLKLWDDLRSSYWFIPTLMSIGAVALSFVTTTIDGRIGPEWIEDIDWLYGNKPAGARALLSTVAGSMIGVAGVTFSITIASVVYASGQYGPRLLMNFMRDRGNQVTLGTFISTFLYCLLVLRTVRSADEAPVGEPLAGDVIGAFVPHVAVLTAIGLALASVAVLIFFIHHIPESIHVSNVIAGVGRGLNGKVDTLFPDRIGGPPPEPMPPDARAEVPASFFDEATPVAAAHTGYIQSLDAEGLLEVAAARDLVLRVKYRPGDFVSEGETLLLAWPRDRVDEAVGDELTAHFAQGRHRTALQDIRFLVNELVEIAARALSPGVNDPFTAINCLDWLGSMLKNLVTRAFPETTRHDADGNVRVVAEPTTFAEFTEAIFDQLRPYVATDRNAAIHAFRILGEVGGMTGREDRLRALRDAADRLLDACETSIPHEADRALLRERHRIVARVLSRVDGYETSSSRYDWFGGTA